jgi:hypothetical protein
MKKNITNLIAQIGRNTSTTRKESFKVTSVNANQYVNKILVEAEHFNEPTPTENYVREEMKIYQMKQQNEEVKNLETNMKRKAERPKDIEHQLNLLEKNYNLLALQEAMASMRSATK